VHNSVILDFEKKKGIEPAFQVNNLVVFNKFYTVSFHYNFSNCNLFLGQIIWDFFCTLIVDVSYY